jgi:hypothetical protein
VVVSEPFEALESFGAIPGVHLEVAELAQFPAARAALLRNAEKRAAIAAKAQALLRKNFLPDHYAEIMLSILSALAANRRAPQGFHKIMTCVNGLRGSRRIVGTR